MNNVNVFVNGFLATPDHIADLGLYGNMWDDHGSIGGEFYLWQQLGENGPVIRMLYTVVTDFTITGNKIEVQADGGSYHAKITLDGDAKRCTWESDIWTGSLPFGNAALAITPVGGTSNQMRFA